MSEFQNLIDALNNHTKALEKFVAAGKGGAAAASTTTAAAATKPSTTKPKGVTLEQVTEKFGAYLKIKDKEVLAERISHVKAINKHFELAKITDGDPAQWKEALGYLAQFEAGEDPFADGDEGDAGDNESLV